MRRRKRKRASDIMAIIVMIVAVGVFLYAAYQLYLIFTEYSEGEQEYDVLREYVHIEEDDTETEDSDTRTTKEIIEANEIPECPVSVDFQSLKAINTDVVGWLYIEAIPKISYPIVQGDDNSYYLHHTVEGVRNSSASIFMDYRNTPDYRDSNTIIYGHNMKNQSMFGLLKKMKDPEVFAKSPYIWIAAEEENICYEIFSVRNVSESDRVYNLLNADPSEFVLDLESFQRASEVENTMTFDGTEQIITLSTCTSNDTVRCVVQAVRKEF